VADQNIDRDRLRPAIRRMRSEYIFYMLDDTIALLPEAKLRNYLNPGELYPDGAEKINLLAEVKAFQQASLSGMYSKEFAINSKNFPEKFSGTLAWIADCRRLLDLCSNNRDASATPGLPKS